MSTGRLGRNLLRTGMSPPYFRSSVLPPNFPNSSTETCIQSSILLMFSCFSIQDRKRCTLSTVTENEMRRVKRGRREGTEREERRRNERIGDTVHVIHCLHFHTHARSLSSHKLPTMRVPVCTSGDIKPPWQPLIVRIDSFQ